MALKVFLLSFILATLAMVHGSVPTPSNGPSQSPVFGAPAPSTDCLELLLSDLKDCVSYVTKGSGEEKPSGDCCTGLNLVVENHGECICFAIEHAAGYGIPIDIDRTADLPSACGIRNNLQLSCHVSSTSPGSSPIHPPAFPPTPRELPPAPGSLTPAPLKSSLPPTPAVLPPVAASHTPTPTVLPPAPAPHTPTPTVLPPAPAPHTPTPTVLPPAPALHTPTPMVLPPAPASPTPTPLKSLKPPSPSVLPPTPASLPPTPAPLKSSEPLFSSVLPPSPASPTPASATQSPKPAAPSGHSPAPAVEDVEKSSGIKISMFFSLVLMSFMFVVA